MNLQPHIKCKEGDVADLVFLVGDPGRIPLVTKYWESAECKANNRGLPVWTGVYKGVPVSVACTAMGCPSAAIVVEELANIGAKYFIRIGTCGGLKEEIKPGDLIIPTAAIRAEGTTKEYIDIEFPAIADMGLVSALEESAKSQNVRYWKGINRTHDAFYEPVQNLSKWGNLINDKRMKGWAFPLVSSEMECSAVFLIPLLRGLKAAAVLCVNTTEPLNLIQENPDLVYELEESSDTSGGIDKAIRVALEAGINAIANQ
ncbi:MAG: nucleoside phosphorylase [bacterium]|nr:nucleoside phosphorylase [bacterium]